MSLSTNALAEAKLNKNKHTKRFFWLLAIAISGSAVLGLIIAKAEALLLNDMRWPQNAIKNWIVLAVILIVLIKPLMRKIFKRKVHPLVAENRRTIATLISVFLVPLILCVFAEVANQGFSGMIRWLLYTDRWEFVARSWILLILMYAFFLCLTSGWFSAFLCGIPSVLLGVINYSKVTLREEPVYPWDIQSLATFFDVAGETDVEITLTSLTAIAVWIFIIVACIPLHVRSSWFEKINALRTWGPAPEKGKNIFSKIRHFFFDKPRMRRLVMTLVTGVLLIAYLAVFFTGPLAYGPAYWQPAKYYRMRGVTTSFFTEMQSLNPKAPEGYSEEEVERIMAKYNVATDTSTPEVQPNIIMIMSESFFDVEERYPDVEYEEPLLPNLRKLQSTATHGELLTPVFGGGTCQSEFEALTGFSMNFLATGVIPYTRFVTEPFHSDAWILGNDGYDVLGRHPAKEHNWNRSVAYPLIGIDDAGFIDYYEEYRSRDPRGYVWDTDVTDRIIKDFDEYKKEDDSPQFQFVVTMQNHGSYLPQLYYPSYFLDMDTPSTMTADTEGKLSVFASGVNRSDRALGWLIDYFEQVDEPTVIVFFGDHQVSLQEGLNQYNYKDVEMSDEEFVDYQYEIKRTPFIIWDNYTDQEEQDLGLFSVYNLSPTLFDLYNIPMPGYYQFLLKVKETSPGIVKELVLHKDGTYSGQENMTSEEQEVYADLEMIQYDYIYGKQYSNQWFEDTSFNNMEG